MVIFHSYVSLPEGIQCWKSSTTQVSQAPRTTKQPPSKNLQHWHHPNGRPKYIWVPMNIPNCFFLISPWYSQCNPSQIFIEDTFPCKSPTQILITVCWSMLKCSSQRHHSLGHRCWKTCSRTSSPTPLVQIISHHGRDSWLLGGELHLQWKMQEPKMGTCSFTHLDPCEPKTSGH